MDWKIIKIIPQEKGSNPTIKDTFNKIFEQDHLLKEELGAGFYEEEIFDFIILHDIPCHPKCGMQQAHLRRQYVSSDNNRQALEVRCLYCHEESIVIREYAP